jgi:hypothetical protein
MTMEHVGLWVRGLVAAVVSAAANSVTVMVVEPMHFNLNEGLGKVGQVALVSALVGAALYLKEHPVPHDGEVSVRWKR